MQRGRQAISGLNRLWGQASRQVSGSNSSPSNVVSAYEQKVTSGLIQADQKQREVVSRLADLETQLKTYTGAVEAYCGDKKAWDARFRELKAELTRKHKERLDQLRAQSVQRSATSASSSDAQSSDDPYQNRPEAPVVVGTASTSSPTTEVKPAHEGILSYFLNSTSNIWASAEGTSPATAAEAAEDIRRQEAKAELARLEQQIEDEARIQAGDEPARPPAPRGLYVYGSVGSGKTLLLDLFYGSVTQNLGTKINARRVHFNAAMLEVHALMHRYEQERLRGEEARLKAFVEREEKRHAKSGEGLVGAFMKGLMLFERDKARHQRAAVVAARRRQRELRGRDIVTSAVELAKSNAAVFRSVALRLMRLKDDEGSVTGGLASTPTLLCWDEAQVNDPFTAVALKGILEHLLSLGAVLVFTSNRHPADLNRYGLHEELFDHFVAKLLASTDVQALTSETDYRKVLAAQAPKLTPILSAHDAAGLAPFSRLYMHPLNETTQRMFEQMWEGIPGDEVRKTLPVAFGRTITVDRTKGGAARVKFEELCARFLGPADYASISSEFDTLFIEGIPHLSFSKRDQARRFITLVDELYNHGVRAVVTASDDPDALFSGTATDAPILDLESLQFETAVEGSRLRRDLTKEASVAPVVTNQEEKAKAQAAFGGMEEKFAFARAVSRLYEMQSPVYVSARKRTGI